jgi:hypothetical protein
LLHFHILTFWKKPVPVLPQVLRRLLTSSAQPILSINLNYLKIIGSFSTTFLYLAVPHVYFGMHSSKKRFHSFNHRLVFRKKGGNFLSPIPIPTYDIATQKSTSFFWKIEMHEVCVSINVSPWCMLTALSTMPCRQLRIIILVSSNFWNFPASDRAALKMESPHVWLDLL